MVWMDNELLKYAMDSGMIDLSYVQGQIEMSKRREMLENIHIKYGKGMLGNGIPICRMRRRGLAKDGCRGAQGPPE